MKIAFLLPAPVLSGGVFIVYEHARLLHLKGHDVRIVYAYGSREINSYPGMDGIPVSDLNDQLETQMDVVVATWWETAYDADRLASKHYAYLIQGDERNFYPSWLTLPRQLIVDSYNFGFSLFATTSALRKMVQSKSNRTCTVIPCAIDAIRFSSALPQYSRSSRVRVLVEGSGRLPHKRVDFAFSVLREFPEVEVYYLSTDGYCDATWRTERVFRKVPYELVPGIMASCDMLLKLSSVESFALPVLEMFASGRTAVVSAFDGHDAYIRDGYNALVVPIDDRAAAIAALRRLVDNPDLRRQLSNNATETCKQFSWDSSSSLFERELQRMCNDSSPEVLIESTYKKRFRRWEPIRFALYKCLAVKDTINRAKTVSRKSWANSIRSAG